MPDGSVVLRVLSQRGGQATATPARIDDAAFDPDRTARLGERLRHRSRCGSVEGRWTREILCIWGAQRAERMRCMGMVCNSKRMYGEHSQILWRRGHGRGSEVVPSQKRMTIAHFRPHQLAHDLHPPRRPPTYVRTVRPRFVDARAVFYTSHVRTRAVGARLLPGASALDFMFPRAPLEQV